MTGTVRIPTVIYHGNREDKIEWVNDGWLEAAADAGATTLAPALIVGRKPTEFIADRQTLHYTQTMLRFSRCRKQYEATYRCDTPLRKRLFKMTATASHGGSLALQHDCIHSESLKQPYLNNIDFLKKIIPRCSTCAKLLMANRWVEPAQALSDGYMEHPQNIGLTYTVCPSCASAFSGEAEFASLP